MTEGIHIILAHVTETVRGVSCSASASCWSAAVTVCDAFPDSTGLQVNYWTLRM